MKNWLHQQIFHRLADQASCLRGYYTHLLAVIPDDFQPDLSVFAERVTVISATQLPQQIPQAIYDLVFVHVLPNELDQQLLIWQLLACLAQDGAMLFFSAWSVDTFCEWGEQIDREFQDMHNVGDQLAQVGWIDTVMSSQRMRVTYDNTEALLHDASVVNMKFEQVSVPATVTYEMAFGHAVFSRTARLRQIGEYEISIDSLR